MRMSHLDGIQHLYNTRVSQCSKFFEGILGEWQSGFGIGVDFEGEDAAVGAILLLAQREVGVSTTLSTNKRGNIFLHVLCHCKESI